jgi:hypothetical protein
MIQVVYVGVLLIKTNNGRGCCDHKWVKRFVRLFDVQLYRVGKFVDFASRVRCHRQKVGLQFLVHEEKLVLISIPLLLLYTRGKLIRFAQPNRI